MTKKVKENLEVDSNHHPLLGLEVIHAYTEKQQNRRSSIELTNPAIWGLLGYVSSYNQHFSVAGLFREGEVIVYQLTSKDDVSMPGISLLPALRRQKIVSGLCAAGRCVAGKLASKETIIGCVPADCVRGLSHGNTCFIAEKISSGVRRDCRNILS